MITNLIIILILILIIIGIILGTYFFLKRKISNFTNTYFGTSNLKDAIEKSEVLASETPKSISSMERIVIPYIKKDFPDLNINELKSMTEEAILKCLNALEKKDVTNLNYNAKIKTWIKTKINDYNNEKVHFDSIKFHQTAISKYEKNDSIATITIQSGLEYYFKFGNSIGKKIQDRFRVEFIYVIDESKIDNTIKSLGLNCPNCGAPIKTLGEKYCHYCGSGIKEIVKKTWSLNNIKNY